MGAYATVSTERENFHFTISPTTEQFTGRSVQENLMVFRRMHAFTTMGVFPFSTVTTVLTRRCKLQIAQWWPQSEMNRVCWMGESSAFPINFNLLRLGTFWDSDFLFYIGNYVY